MTVHRLHEPPDLVVAYRGLGSFFAVVFGQVDERVRALSRGPVCCVSVVGNDSPGDAGNVRVDVQLTPSAPPASRGELRALFRTLPPRAIVAWYGTRARPAALAKDGRP